MLYDMYTTSSSMKLQLIYQCLPDVFYASQFLCELVGLQLQADVNKNGGEHEAQAQRDCHHGGETATADSLASFGIVSKEAGLGSLALGADVAAGLLREGRGQVVDEAAIDAQVRGARLLRLSELARELLGRGALRQALHVDSADVRAADDDEVDGAGAGLHGRVCERNVVRRPQLVAEEGAVVDDLVTRLHACRGRVALRSLDNHTSFLSTLGAEGEAEGLLNLEHKLLGSHNVQLERRLGLRADAGHGHGLAGECRPLGQGHLADGGLSLNCLHLV
mmetsp:Transcript_5133/g.8922  ORF Transcript_5133/g.8922 Transcript_5133/m.8922 type:complete len:278 (+) Transcript_5133:45-878(+)